MIQAHSLHIRPAGSVAGRTRWPGPKRSSRKPGVLSRNGRYIRNAVCRFSMAAHHAPANLHTLVSRGLILLSGN